MSNLAKHTVNGKASCTRRIGATALLLGGAAIASVAISPLAAEPGQFSEQTLRFDDAASFEADGRDDVRAAVATFIDGMTAGDAQTVWMFASEEDQAAFGTERAVYDAFAEVLPALAAGRGCNLRAQLAGRRHALRGALACAMRAARITTPSSASGSTTPATGRSSAPKSRPPTISSPRASQRSPLAQPRPNLSGPRRRIRHTRPCAIACRAPSISLLVVVRDCSRSAASRRAPRPPSRGDGCRRANSRAPPGTRLSRRAAADRRHAARSSC